VIGTPSIFKVIRKVATLNNLGKGPTDFFFQGDRERLSTEVE
jgi:hypothetical protein